jgi:hypothetical protein
VLEEARVAALVNWCADDQHIGVDQRLDDGTGKWIEVIQPLGLSQRGLKVGQVMGRCQSSKAGGGICDGQIDQRPGL